SRARVFPGPQPEGPWARMGVPDDANPLNRSLPAEVITRSRAAPKREKEEAPPLNVDPRTVLAMKPEHRLKWLTKAMQRCQQGKVEKTVIYDIMTHAKFTSDCSTRLGAKMYRLVRAHLDFFSQKQKRFLEGESALVKLFKKAVKKGEAGEAGEDIEEVALPSDKKSRSEEPEKQEQADLSEDRPEEGDAEGGAMDDMAVLWARLTAVSSEERADAVAALDAKDKERLEDFLEARISGSKGSAASNSRPPVQQAESEEEDEEAANQSEKEVEDAEEEADEPRGSRSRSRGRDKRRRSSDSESSHGKEKAERKRARSKEAKKEKKSSRDETSEKDKDRDRDRRGRRDRGGRRGRSSSGSRSASRSSKDSDGSSRKRSRSRGRRRR
ncbi:unnamed protein product, partial [Polarella glacialis]